MELEERILRFTQAYGISLSRDQVARLVQLDRFLLHWNRAVNLSGFRDGEERFRRYFAEPLHASLWAPEEGVALDIGSGGGSPALPLAVARPRLRWTLIEPRRRRTLFLEEAIHELRLSGARVLRCRLEELDPREALSGGRGTRPGAAGPHGEGFSLVTSRGLASAKLNLRRVAPWLEPRGRILLFTGGLKAGSLKLPEALSLLERVRLAPGFSSYLVVIGAVEPR